MRIALLLLLSLMFAGAAGALEGSPLAQLFVHPLVSSPERAFRTSSDAQRMDLWFVTTREFRAALEELDARGYTLVRASDVFHFDGDRTVLEVPALPPGRRPLLLSVDDLNYYPYMRANGTASRLEVDDQGQLGARIPGRKGLAFDTEVPQVVDRFVEEHPDFSYRGARGLVAVTGYAGVFGWATQQAPGPGLEAAQAGALRVAQWFKAHGWEFASHSYAHRMRVRQDDGAWKVSEQRWASEVRPLVGPTPYYVLPFGERWWTDPQRWAALKAAGYRVFFGVETTSNLRWKDGLPIVGRVPLDGRGLRHSPKLLRPFLDVRAVWDPLRPGPRRG